MDAVYSGDESDQDIEWEEAKIETEVDWEQVNAQLNEQVSTEAKKSEKKKVVRKFSTLELVLQHKVHLMCLVAREQKIHSVCMDTHLQAMILSYLPIDQHVQADKLGVNDIHRLIKWFQQYFQVIPITNTTAFHHYTFKHLQTVVAESQGYDYQLVILFVALCRALGIQTRYTCVLDPRHLRSAKTHVQYFSPSIEAVAAHVWGDGGRDSPEQKRSRRNASVAPRIWTELYCMGRWIHVDPIYYHVDTPYEVERARGRGRNVSYVISQEASGRILDVTRRYASSWSKTLRLRLAHPLIIWWETLLRDSSPASAAASIHEKEDVALEMNIQQQPPPTSIAGFKKHHIYCLERFIGKYECIYPRKAVGVFKGQPYFLRCAIQQLQTKHNWRKKGRRILDDEIDTPIKKLEMKDRDPLRLYGEWQTVIYKADPLIDGIVPLNEYGNMEVWSTADVPVNATHLKLPRISTIAKKLGLSYAPAVVGFEVKNGMNRPIFDGIIVATESVRMIEEANAMVQQQKLEKAIEHNQKLIYKRWARMIKGISLRTRLQHDYGPY